MADYLSLLSEVQVLCFCFSPPENHAKHNQSKCVRSRLVMVQCAQLTTSILDESRDKQPYDHDIFETDDDRVERKNLQEKKQIKSNR